MTLEELNIQLSVPLLIGGVIAAIVGLVWFLIRVFRRRRLLAPLGLVVGGLLIAATPSVVARLLPTDLSGRDKLVDGQRNITLTGAKDKDDQSKAVNYEEFLRDKKDAAVLQMANANVTNGTLELLVGFDKLKRLDVGRSQVSDAGLRTIAQLPALEELFLTGTAVTDAGLLTNLKPHPKLKRLDVRDTKISAGAAKEWQDAMPGRRIIR